MTVDGFSLTKHSLSRRTECTKISSLFFSPLRSASLSKSRWTRLQKAEQLSTRQEGEALSGSRTLVSVPWLHSQRCRAVGKEAYHTATTVLCQLRFDSATIRKAALEMRYDGVALKMSPFIIYHKAVVCEVSGHLTASVASKVSTVYKYLPHYGFSILLHHSFCTL